MKLKTSLLYLIAATLLFNVGLVAQEMTKEQWQNEINQATTKRNELRARLDQFNADINNLMSQSAKLDGDITTCEDELFAMMGVTRDQVMAFDRELSGYEQRADELMKMADADVVRYRDEINTMSKRVDEMRKDKIARLTRFASRLSNLRSNIDGLLNTLARAGMASVYTVGTWARDRDCLWNIAKKPNIYGNAWLWPKIWQGNKDKIRDPDIIQPGWTLNIPTGNELSRDERSAANTYYRSKGQ